ALGNISMEHQGHRIETIRINNDTDGYVINGWESEIIENHSGVVDCFRNPKGDPSIIARFNQPTYVAVMPRSQIVRAPGDAHIDFSAINETTLSGPHTPQITAKDPAGNQFFSQKSDVTLAGGDTYGQLLIPDITIPVPATAVGMIRVTATLLNSTQTQVA